MLVWSNYFADAYFDGNTPNPCIQCNLMLKWDSLIKIADERGIKHIATGHYAKVVKEGKTLRAVQRCGSKERPILFFVADHSGSIVQNGFSLGRYHER